MSRNSSQTLGSPSPLGGSAEDLYTSTRWLLLAFLVLLNFFNMVDRQIISTLSVVIQKDIDVSPVGIGLLTGYAFSTLYSVMGLYLGIIADRVNRVRLIAIGLFLWSGATAISGVAASFNQLLLARIFVGIGEATLTPAAVSMLMEVFPAKQRSLAAGVYYAGLPLGVSASFVVAAKLEPSLGWRNCFYLLGITGIVLSGLVLLLRESRPSEPLRGSWKTVERSLAELPKVLFGNGPLMLVMIGGCALNTGVGATMLDVVWMKTVHGMDSAKAAGYMAIFFLCGGLPGNFLGGWLGGFVEHRLKIHRLYAVLIMMCVCVPMLLVYRLAPSNSEWMWVGYFFTAMSVTMYYGPVLSTVTELAPSHLKSTIVGVFLIGLNLLGISLGALMGPIIGRLFGSLTIGLIAVGLCNLVCIPAFLLAIYLQRRSQTQPKTS